MEATMFQDLPNLNYPNFRVIRTKHSLIHKVLQGAYHIGLLVYLQFPEKPIVCYVNRNAEKFEKLNAIGILKDVLLDNNLQITRMVFLLEGKKYETTRNYFIKNCSEISWDFGVKCFLSIDKFNSIDNYQLELFEGGNDGK